MINEKSGKYHTGIIERPEGKEHVRRVASTHNKHPHWDQLQEAKEVWRQANTVSKLSDKYVIRCWGVTMPWPDMKIYIMVGKWVQDRKWENTAIHGFLQTQSIGLVWIT